MPGIKAGRKLYLGQESVAGTPVAGTALWRGKVELPDDTSVFTFPEENVGYIMNAGRVYNPQLGVSIALPATELTFEQGPYVFAAGIKNTVTGAADGGGSDKVYAYAEHYDASSLNTLKTFTLWTGDNQSQDRIEYGFVTDFTLSGKPGQAIMIASNWQGRQISSGSFPTVSVPTVEEVLFSKGTLAIDNTSGSTGQTVKSNTLLGMDLAVKTGWIPVFTGDGQLYFSFIKATGDLDISLKITFEHDSTAVAEKAAWRAMTTRFLRLNFPGSTVGTPGTTYSTKLFRLDMAGKWEKFDKIGEDKGNDIVTGTFKVGYISSTSFTATFVNELASLI